MIGTFLAFLFVFGVLAAVAWALFEMSPFARHKDQFCDPPTREANRREPPSRLTTRLRFPERRRTDAHLLRALQLSAWRSPCVTRR